MQFFVFGDVAAEPIDGSNSVLQRGISPPDSKAQRAHLVLLSILPLITEAEIVGTVAEYDDPASERPVDYREVYDTEGNLVALSWFDGFGIQRVAVDRGLVEESGEPRRSHRSSCGRRFSMTSAPPCYAKVSAGESSRDTSAARTGCRS
jgi:hypothetical protein